MMDTILASLNKEQRKAVETIDGPVMVLAGPGTGKTQVLAARIAHIITSTDTPPYAILALTFTESAAANMRERVVSMIGKDGYYVNISTFHSFCADVIRSNPEYFSIDRKSEPLGELEKYDLFQRLIDQASLKALKPFNQQYFYIDDIISSISQLKREGFNPEQFKKIVAEEFADKNKPDKKTALTKFLSQKEKNEELSLLYEAYYKDLKEIQRYDFDDMIALVAEAFNSHAQLLREYQEKLHYFLVDEYQDTNSAQNAVVDLLGSYWEEKANIFVVGDPHQSIFRFQGASVENTFQFLKKYPGAEKIELETVYRCTQIICDAAIDVIKNNTLTEVPHLKSDKKGGEPIVIAELPTQTHEIFYVADQVKKLIEKGVEPEEIAILYHKNNEAGEIQQILEKWGIAYEVDGGENILATESIQQFLRFLHLIADIKNNREDDTMYEVLSYNWIALDKTLVMKTARAAGKAKLSLFSLIQSGYDTFKKHHQTNEVTPLDFRQLEEFVENLVRWSAEDANKTFTLWFEDVLNQSGYLAWIKEQPAKAELLIAVNTLYREVKAMNASQHRMKLADFIVAMDTMQEHNIRIFAEDLNVRKGAVHISTVHKAKGREWQHVFLIHCFDTNWGNVRKYNLIPLPAGLTPFTDLSLKEKNEDERRLFYVAITRAKETVTITYPEATMQTSRSREVVPSMFLQEMGEKRVKKIADIMDVETSNKYLERMLEPKAPQIIITDREYFLRIIKNFKLSSTALNTYLRNPQEFIDNSLLRVPRSKPVQMSYGTAMHKVLEHFVQLKSSGKVPTFSMLAPVLEESLKGEILTDEDFSKYLTKGNESLKNYIAAYNKEEIDVLYVERQFGFGFGKTILDDIPLSGRLDRIDWVDKEKKTVRVVDYKTGGAKTANEIEGKTASVQLSERELALPESIRGPYKRQLLFYKLLTELDQTFIPTVTEGMFDFVEPDKYTGKLVRREFSLRDEDVKDLKELIREVMKEIRELKFLD
jgi:DNA helicase-2/ATP-dependent DNA helicase PcrA